MNKSDISNIEDIIGYTFVNKKILENAFTHSSFSAENNTPSNERLEFLGDSILNFVVAEYLYEKRTINEGDMSMLRANLVSREPLARVIEKLSLAQFLIVGKGQMYRDKHSVMADLFEAIIAGIYIDSGKMDKCREFILTSLEKEFATRCVATNIIHYKTRLQEFLQAQAMPLPEYKEISRSGASHTPTFTMSISISGKEYGQASASSKKEAETKLAKIALEKLKAEHK